jgi:methylated-DNA-[protein]-cysteine S-methyltransferase
MTNNFFDKVYSQLKKVPPGKVTTYKAIAESLNSKAYRAVGTAMKKNPDAPNTPCHRVVSSSGLIGGYKGVQAGEAVSEKIVMLRNEGVEVVGGKVKDFEEKLFAFEDLF